MNGAPDDILRSLRRYVSLALGSPPWTVRTERQNVADDERPVAVVEPSTPITTPAAHARAGHMNQGDVQKMQGFSVMAYVAIAQTARESRLAAAGAGELLDDAFTVGLVDAATDAPIGAPFRVPVFDFAGVPVAGGGRAGPEAPYMYAWVEDLSTRPVQDPIDPVRFTVTCDLRLSWWRGGRIPPAAPIAQQMPGTFAQP